MYLKSCTFSSVLPSKGAFSCFDRCYYPDCFAFPFEYNRLTFSKYGSLSEPTEELTRLLIGGIVIIRLIVLKIILCGHGNYRRLVTLKKHSVEYCQLT